MKTYQRGITLIELMISLTLSLGVIAGISGLFVQMKSSDKLQLAASEIADTSNYVLEIIKREVRRAGGLKSPTDVNGSSWNIFLGLNDVLAANTDAGVNLNFNRGDYIVGATQPSVAPYTGTQGGSDAWIIRYQLMDASDLGASTPSNGYSPCTQQVLLETGENPEVQEHVVSVLFFVKDNNLYCTAQRAVQDNDGTANGPVLDDNSNRGNEWCAKNCTTPRTGPTSSPADFVPIGEPVQLVTNVVKLKAKYGVDANDDNAANYYVNAADVPNWQSVVSMRVTLLIRNEADHVADSIQSYVVEDETYTPTDRKLYRLFTTTIALRNRVLGS